MPTSLPVQEPTESVSSAATESLNMTFLQEETVPDRQAPELVPPYIVPAVQEESLPESGAHPSRGAAVVALATMLLATYYVHVLVEKLCT